MRGEQVSRGEALPAAYLATVSVERDVRRSACRDHRHFACGTSAGLLFLRAPE